MTNNRKIVYLVLVVVAGLFMFSRTIILDQPQPSKLPESLSSLLPTPRSRKPANLVETVMTGHNLQPITAVQKPTPRRIRIAVIAYIPTESYVYQFLTMLYGSWRYITENRYLLLSKTAADNSPIVDIHAYCHPDVCRMLANFCMPYPIDISDPKLPRSKDDVRNYSQIVANSAETCWRFFESRTADYGYDYINAYIMFLRKDISDIGRPYDKFMRSDLDCFLTPQFLVWKPKFHIVVGTGGYCVPFNEQRLKAIAQKLNLIHRGVHCVGSTWFGDVRTFVSAAKLTINMTEHFFKHEFDTNLPGLEKIDFNSSPYGVWPEWWKLVSSMYGGELAMNHLIEGFNQSFKAPLDGLSTSNDSVWTVPHIHCWHGNTEFNKFTYTIILEKIFAGTGEIEAAKVNEIVKNAEFKNAKNMTLRQYSEYIAWNSFLKYLPKFLVRRA